jgi:hypothetical protein
MIDHLGSGPFGALWMPMRGVIDWRVAPRRLPDKSYAGTGFARHECEEGPMGDIIRFPDRRGVGADQPAAPRQASERVFENRGWRILEVPAVGRFLAVSDYRRDGVEIGRFDPRADRANHHEGTEVAILTRCRGDEKLSRCAIAWLNSGGPSAAILGAFVVAAGGRYHFWRDAIVEVAAIGGTRLVRLIDGSIAIAREAEPVPLLDPFAPLPEHRRRAAFDRLPAEAQAAVMSWADPRGEFRGRLDRAPPH